MIVQVLVALGMLAGVVSSLLPILPGTVIIWASIILHKLWFGDDSVAWWVVIFTGVLAALAQLLDILAGYWGARRFGATRAGAIGALVGGIVGPFVSTPLFGWFSGPFAPLFGLIIGPIVGALVGEMAQGRTTREAGRAGFGTVVGGVVAFAAKFGIGLFMVGFFYILLWTR